MNLHTAVKGGIHRHALSLWKLFLWHGYSYVLAITGAVLEKGSIYVVCMSVWFRLRVTMTQP